VRQFLVAGCLVQTAHGEEVVDLDASRWDIRPHPSQLGVMWVKALQFVPKLVKLSVADLGFSEVVVQVRMMGDSLGKKGDSRLVCLGESPGFAHGFNRGATGYEASLSGRSIKLERYKFAVFKRASRHHRPAQNTEMNFGNHVDGRSEHVASMGLEVVVGKGRVKMSKRLPVFSASEVALKRHEFGTALKRHAMVDVVIIHVAVRAVPRSANTAGDGGSVKAEFVGQALQRGVDFLAGIQPNKDVVIASCPFHALRYEGEPMSMPFTRIRLRGGSLNEPVPWL